MNRFALWIFITSLMGLNGAYAKKFDRGLNELQRPELARLQGGVDSGGGTIVSLSGHNGLLDLYLYSPETFLDKTPGALQPDPAFINQTLAYLALSKKSSPIVAASVSEALRNLPVYFVNDGLDKKLVAYYLPPGTNLKRESMFTGALYFKNFGVVISETDFKALSLKNQMALLIHEALRHLQLSLGQNEIDNELLQVLTARFFQPAQQSLDDEDLLRGELQDLVKQKKAILQNLQNDIAALCPEFQEACQLKINFGALGEQQTNSDYHKLVESIVNKGNSSINAQEQRRLLQITNRLMENWKSVIHYALTEENQSYRQAIFDLK